MNTDAGQVVIMSMYQLKRTLMLLKCGYCNGAKYQKTGRVDVMEDKQGNFITIDEMHCPRCGNFTHFDNDKIIDRDGNLGIKGT